MFRTHGMNLQTDVLRVLEETSRTFHISITRLPSKLQEAATAAYLSMRALDEIEDHIRLNNACKEKLLHKVSWLLQTHTALDGFTHFGFDTFFRPYQTELPEVTLRIGEWLSYPSEDIAPRIWYAAATMADRMAYWVRRNWKIRTEIDLNRYTFDVAGAVGLLSCDLWSWFAGRQIDRAFAIQLGRGLQAVNILRNREEDIQRQVDFYPLGWRQEHMFTYAHNNLNRAKEKVKFIPPDAFTYLFEIPLVLAEATLDALENGKTKLTRRQVRQIINRLDERKRA
ncbi:MAG TPA: squalene/phytoene synthase family protein [Candidatus Bathyarchaeia archaeon]|nr:squalene/phytoene synthase family protein [Candidatus Bathyarchaeia archaeon]